MFPRKIACVTGTRADYPRVKAVLKEILSRESLALDLIVTGTHLMEEYGLSISEIEADGIPIFSKVPMYDAGYNSPLGMARACAKCTFGLADALHESAPDLVLLTVDRVETLSAVTAASLMNFPIAHIQGGEVTGTIDESIRHAVTKMSHIHFPSTEDAAERIRRMGEREENIHQVGCPYIDVIHSSEVVHKRSLATRYGFSPDADLIIFTQHPVTTEYEKSRDQIKETISALDGYKNYQVIAFFSNADAGGREIIEELQNLDHIKILRNMTSKDFISLMACAKLMVGNSSAGIREAPSFKLPVINIGSRQNGRLRAKNVIDVEHDAPLIASAINKALYDVEFLSDLKSVENPYGDGQSSKRIVDVLETVELTTSLIQKEINYVL